MVKLTEDMVIARSKGSDLQNVRKLNCWGSELSDVAVVRKLQNVEVLSLSVNRICTLADFQYCPNLQELYIRKNSITDINEVLYLRQLPKLKSLWLADNPCAEFEQYRLTVLRALPHLQKLDNVTVDSEEVQKAMVCGVPLPSNDPARAEEEREMPRSSSIGESLRSESGGGSSLSDCSPPSSERRYSQSAPQHRSAQQGAYEQGLDDGYEYSQAVYEDEEQQPVQRRSTYNNYTTTDPERRISQVSYQGSSPQGRVDEGIKGSHSREVGGVPGASAGPQLYRTNRASQLRQQQLTSSLGHSHYSSRLLSPQSPSRRSSQLVAEPDSSGDSRGYIRSPESSCTHTADYDYDSRNANYLSREDTAPSRRASQEQREARWCEGEERERAYSRGDGYGYVTSPDTQQSPMMYEQRAVGQDTRYSQQSRSENNRAAQQHYDNAYRRAEQQMDSASRAPASERSSPTKPYPARPKTRNANLLSAVLCLIKELDYTSLEVVEMAVRCRMEELDD